MTRPDGEPPVWADPRRWGGLIGVAGGLVFLAAYAPALGAVVSAILGTVGVVLALTVLMCHYVRPVSLGPLVRPQPAAFATYVGCVAAEVLAIGVGSEGLADAGQEHLRPALIVCVVGLHFLPLAWAFRERMFLWLGALVAALGAAELSAGRAGVDRAAEVAAAAAGLTLLVMSLMYARGLFRRSPGARPAS